MSSAQPRVGTRQILAFAIGELGIHMPFMSMLLFLMFFYTDVVGLSAVTAGMIFMVASVWDAITDPPMGLITDRTRTRWGSCRPYFLFGALPLAGSLVLVFYVPPLSGTALVAWLLAALMLFRTSFTVVGIPYAAYSARITTDSRTRTTIAGFKLFFTIGAGSLVAWLMLPLAERFGAGNAADGFFWAVVVFAVAPLIFLPITFLGTHEPPLSERARTALAIADYVRFYASNRAFWIVLVCIAAVISAQVVTGTASLYFFKYYLNDEATVPLSLTLSMVVGLVVTPLWVLLERRIGKKAAWMTGSALGLAVLAYFALGSSITSREYLVICVLVNGALYGLTVTMWSMLPDTVEYGEWRSGVRAESTSFGLALFALKVAMGVATAALGFALDAIGFVPNGAQSPGTLASLKGIAVGFPALLFAMSVLAAGFYPMRKGDHERIVEVLARRRSDPHLRDSGSVSRLQEEHGIDEIYEAARRR